MGYIVSQEYDTNNNIVKVVDALGNYETYEYDLLGQVIKTTNPMGKETGYKYDSQGNIISITNTLGGITTYDYDLCNQLTSVTDPLNNTTNYTYDSMGNVISITNAQDKVTSYTYDLENRLTSVINSDGTSELITYDLIGNIKSLVYPNGDTITYDYDRINNLVSKNYSKETNNVLYLYDQNGNRVSMTDSTGESTYEYDIMDRVTSVTDGNGKTIQYSYDDCGRLGSITYNDGRIVKYEYDLNDRIVFVNDEGNITNYNYDAAGNLIKTIRPDGSYTDCTYNKLGSIDSLINYSADGKKISVFYYTYDERGYISTEISEQDGVSVIRNYEYNLAGELEYFSEDDGNNLAEYEYSYDKSGNRTRLEKKGIELPETITYTYDSDNRLIKTESSINGTTIYSYDLNGNLINEQSKNANLTYEYTVEQRLAAVMDGEELLMAAIYDGDCNRVFQSTRYETVEYVTIEKDVEEETTEASTETQTEPTEGSTESNTEEHTDETGETTTEATIDTTASDEDETSTEETSDNMTNEEPTSKEDKPVSDETDKDVVIYYDKVYIDPGKTIFWYGFGQSIIQSGFIANSAVCLHLSQEFNKAWDAVTASYELVPRAESVSVEMLSEELKNQYYNSNIIIPENCDIEVVEIVDVKYELTYYVNNINSEISQVLMEYDADDNVTASYTYGNSRINKNAGDENNYYLYDGRGSVTQVINKDEIVASYSYDPYGNVTCSAPETESFYGYNA